MAFFSYQGRISRLRYILISLIFLAVYLFFPLIMVFFISVNLQLGEIQHGGLQMIHIASPRILKSILLILTVIPFWLLFSFPSVKRLHDLGFSGRLFSLVMFVPFYAFCTRYIFPVFFENTDLGIMGNIMFFEIGGLLTLCFLFLKKGTKGPNLYGPAPLNQN